MISRKRRASGEMPSNAGSAAACSRTPRSTDHPRTRKIKKAANQQIKQLAASLSPSSASSSSSSSSSKIKGIRTATNTVDVRGLQLGEAQEEVLGFLMKTQASKKGARHVAYIAHGHGTGKDMNVLKNGLRQWFASGKTPVTDHAPADMEDGGDAYTIVAWGG
mmetsp:Transcript_20412/g.39348  ORF Transcript_20412/g.39348 Transcript_20412/m.39348 type:complete len:163 (-) Transcript_20412:276-764(-)